MNLFSFTANFDSEESCRLHFKSERDKIVVCAVVVQLNIFSIGASGAMNARNAGIELL